MTAREIVARALFDANLWRGAWDKANEVEKNDALFKADAALLALDEAGWAVVDRDKLVRLLNIMPDTRVVESARAMISTATTGDA